MVKSIPQIISAGLITAGLLLAGCGGAASPPADIAPTASQPPASSPTVSASPTAQATPTVRPSPTVGEPPGCLRRYRPGIEVEDFRSSAFVDGVHEVELNGDGLIDILVTRARYQTPMTFPIEFLINTGNADFKAATADLFVGPVPEVQHPREVLIDDFNGDGRDDIFIADHGDDRDPWPGYQNTLVLSSSDGTYMDATANLPQQSDFTHSASAADVDGDNDIDLFVGNIYGAGNYPPQIWLNDGSGTFEIATGLLPGSVTSFDRNIFTTNLLVDVNNDGSQDLILGATADAPASLLLMNDGSGRFSILPDALPAKPNAPTDIALDIKSLDVNSDGYPDLLMLYTQGNPPYIGWYVQILVNRQDGTFADETPHRMPESSDGSAHWMIWIDLIDIDVDGDADILGHLPEAREPTVFLNDGDGVFAPARIAVTLPDAAIFAVVDAEGDGGRDFFSAIPADGFTEVHYLYLGRGC